ncbi:MAG TPA: ChaB family protein, partial [Thermoanaerobaculia bacterium]|nr:ChaB family protein [Thermoanaerobaculia bacterium]
MYETISDLPLVCRINLPEPALKVYRAAFNRAWKAGQPHVLAQKAAWDAVREEFEREKEMGRWVR